MLNRFSYRVSNFIPIIVTLEMATVVDDDGFQSVMRAGFQSNTRIASDGDLGMPLRTDQWTTNDDGCLECVVSKSLG